MTDLQFFRQHDFEYKPESRAVEKYFFDAALTVRVYSLFECFEICYITHVKRGGALFSATLNTHALTREDAIKAINEFAQRMKL